jgi:CBS domain-containing protein
MLALTDLLGGAVRDAAGRRVGRLADLGVRLDGPAPLVATLHVRTARRAHATVVPWAGVATFEVGDIALGPAAGAPAPADNGDGDGELRLARDVLDAQIYDTGGARVRRAGDVDLERRAGELRVVAVEVGWAALLRRLGLRRLAARRNTDSIGWADLHVVSGRGHGLMLASPAAAVHRLRRGDLARLVAELPPVRGADVLRTVGAHRAAGAISATRPGSGGRLLETLPPADAAPIVAAMAPDDAVAALRALDADALERLLDEVGSAHAAELRRLLAHPAGTAAGLMRADVLRVPAGAPATAARAVAAAEPGRLEGQAAVFVVDDDGRPAGVLTPLMLLAGTTAPAPALTVRARDPVATVADLFALHDVLAVAVVDDAGRLIGAVAVDDVLEELLAERLPGARDRGFATTRRRHAA